jgi:hypothetical protein
MYYRARYYSPDIGRFVSVDPDPGKMERPSSFLSKYIHTENNPILFSDPQGKGIFLTLFIIGSIIGGAQNFSAAFNSRDENGEKPSWGKIFSSTILGAVTGGLLEACLEEYFLLAFLLLNKYPFFLQ